MIVVSDTSPLSNLILIERLDILHRLYSEIIVPPAVDREVKALEGLGHQIDDYKNASWIRIVSPTNQQKVVDLRFKLDTGESEAIALALEIDCDLLLMDERLGTTVARGEGLRTIGLAGLIIEAKQQRIIVKVGPLLTELRDRAGFWLGKRLEHRILETVGE